MIEIRINLVLGKIEYFDEVGDKTVINYDINNIDECMYINDFVEWLKKKLYGNIK